MDRWTPGWRTPDILTQNSNSFRTHLWSWDDEPSFSATKKLAWLIPVPRTISGFPCCSLAAVWDRGVPPLKRRCLFLGSARHVLPVWWVGTILHAPLSFFLVSIYIYISSRFSRYFSWLGMHFPMTMGYIWKEVEVEPGDYPEPFSVVIRPHHLEDQHMLLLWCQKG